MAKIVDYSLIDDKQFAYLNGLKSNLKKLHEELNFVEDYYNKLCGAIFTFREKKLIRSPSGKVADLPVSFTPNDILLLINQIEKLRKQCKFFGGGFGKGELGKLINELKKFNFKEV